MIIPTAEFDPMFADNGIPFRTKMLAYIAQEFADLLGDGRRLLRNEGGLDQLSLEIASARSQVRPQAAA
jgi:hypothetical protein